MGEAQARASGLRSGENKQGVRAQTAHHGAVCTGARRKGANPFLCAKK